MEGFLDAERKEYSGWWPHLRRVLSLRGLLIVDFAACAAVCGRAQAAGANRA
jgi:hypothetical protein